MFRIESFAEGIFFGNRTRQHQQPEVRKGHGARFVLRFSVSLMLLGRLEDGPGNDNASCVRTRVLEGLRSHA